MQLNRLGPNNNEKDNIGVFFLIALGVFILIILGNLLESLV